MLLAGCSGSKGSASNEAWTAVQEKVEGLDPDVVVESFAAFTYHVLFGKASFSDRFETLVGAGKRIFAPVECLNATQGLVGSGDFSFGNVVDCVFHPGTPALNRLADGARAFDAPKLAGSIEVMSDVVDAAGSAESLRSARAEAQREAPRVKAPIDDGLRPWWCDDSSSIAGCRTRSAFPTLDERLFDDGGIARLPRFDLCVGPDGELDCSRLRAQLQEILADRTPTTDATR